MPEVFTEKLSGGETGMTLIGWAAYDFPICAHYGYIDPDDSSSAIATTEGSYQLVSMVSESRPSTDRYALGTFGQDWEYVERLSDLDEFNGRTGDSPGVPGDIYHYIKSAMSPGDVRQDRLLS